MSISENVPVFPVVCIIPSLNPDEKFINTVHGIFAAGFTDLIVVDDGSRESCQYYFEEVSSIAGCTVLHHEINRGKGRALKTAFAYYLEHYDQARYIGVVTADADGQHLPEDIRKTAEALIVQCNQDPKKRSSFCMVLGTRDFDEEIVPFKSRNGNKITSLVFQILYGKHIQDTQTGLRAISNDFLAHCGEVPGERFEYEIKMLIDAVSRKIRIIEVPIRTVYFDHNRETHFHPVKDSLRIYRIIFSSFFKFASSGLLCVILDQGVFALFNKLILASFTATVSISLSTVIARGMSSFINYAINRTIVFQKKRGYRDLIRYYILCVLQAAASAGLVSGLYHLWHLDPSFLKLIVDSFLFFISFQIQRLWVFREEPA